MPKRFSTMVAITMPAFALLLAAGMQWNGPQSLIGTDGIEYVRTGLSIVREGTYTNQTGEADLWIPPLYPLLIGVLSLGGTLDPFATARCISIAMTMLAVGVTAWVALKLGRSPLVGLASGALLAVTPTVQVAALSALSEASAAAIAICTFAAWCGLDQNSTPWRYATIGTLGAACYLTRPEWLVLFPLLGMATLITSPRTFCWRRWAIGALAFILLCAPYISWLAWTTGSFSVFGERSKVVLASGIASYSRSPRERLDIVSGKLTYLSPELSFRDHAKRYKWNLERLREGFYQSFGRRLVSWPLALAALAGVAHLALRRQWCPMLGLASFFVYLPIVAAFDVKMRYLVGALPAFSVFFSLSLASVISIRRRWLAGTLAVVGLTLISAVAMLNGQRPRVPSAPERLQREAGWALSRLSERGVVYERWFNVAYYGEQRAHVLTRDDLTTVLAYIERREPASVPVWIAVGSFQKRELHPSVIALLDFPVPMGFTQVVGLAEGEDRIVVLRVDREISRSLLNLRTESDVSRPRYLEGSMILSRTNSGRVVQS